MPHPRHSHSHFLGRCSVASGLEGVRGEMMKNENLWILKKIQVKKMMNR